MEYRKKVSQASNLNDYSKKLFSSDTIEDTKYLDRPSFIKQSFLIDGSCDYIKPVNKIHYLDKQSQEQQKHLIYNHGTIAINAGKNSATTPQNFLNDIIIEQKNSPTSSITSHKPLEWDSGADVGYVYSMNNLQDTNSIYQFQPFNMVEYMALQSDCSIALRLDPEGITKQQQQQSSVVSSFGKPNANSTPLICNISGSGSGNEIEITPVVKDHPLDILKSDEYVCTLDYKDIKNIKDTDKDSKSSNFCKCLRTLKYGLETSKTKVSILPIIENTTKHYDSNDVIESVPLKKSKSVNILTLPTSQFPLKRSQSELIFSGQEKITSQLFFKSTSSIATVINNIPATFNKLLKTSVKSSEHDFLRMQTSVQKDEALPVTKPMNLSSKFNNSFLKISKDVSQCENLKISNIENRLNTKEKKSLKQENNSSSNSYDISLVPPEDTEKILNPSNSSDISTGPIYENILNNSHVSSVDTGCSNSTILNTSSSVEEKLWGNSDSVVRDIERIVNILKKVLYTKKLDEHVKKRLLHHVLKRLVNTKYTDDKIEHNLEENVPWNPADTRNKVYRADNIQALRKNTIKTFENWKPLQKKKCMKKVASENKSRTIKSITTMPVEFESGTSEKFDTKTDRIIIDGRKARMELRNDIGDTYCSSNLSTNKSENSECFLPQQESKINKLKDMFITSTSNASLPNQHMAILDAAVNSRCSRVDSNNETSNCINWRLPTTLPEQVYELQRHDKSDLANTKFVSYTEIEKHNVLTWITNEISHLSNLKKLLEEPQLKSDKLDKFLARKIKHQQKKINMKQYKYVTDFDDNLLNKQWSSHHNLTNFSSLLDTNIIRHLKKRNSCTQTASNNSSAYSRTGSEIISAKIENINIKFVDAYVQTPKSLQSPTLDSFYSKVYTDFPIHQAVSLNCMCNEQVCVFCKFKHSPQDRLLPVFIEDKQKDHQFKYKDVKKETIKQINEKKSEFNDKRNDNQESRNLKKAVFNKCRCKEFICLCKRYDLSQKYSGKLFKKCECEENKLISNFEKMNIKKFSKKKLFGASTKNKKCICEYKNFKDIQSERLEYSISNKEKVQPHYLFNSEHTYKIKSMNQDKISVLTTQPFSSATLTEHKCCPICGMVYQNERSCECTIKNYPKSVAYELSFEGSNKKKHQIYRKRNFEIKSLKKDNLPKGTIYENNTKSCICETSQIINQNNRSNVTHCHKFNVEEKLTLQDYLISNNRTFAENVETRRQYVSEIQRLRHLRKDKQLQLLSLTTIAANNVVSSKPYGVKQCTQKKISDEDMRMRLRKRYFQLTEVKTKRKQQQLQQEARCNKLMAKIFCKKLQQKVLRGEVDFSHGVSFLSNL